MLPSYFSDDPLGASVWILSYLRAPRLLGFARYLPMGHRYRDPADNLLGFPRETSYLARRYTEIYYIRTKLAGAILPSRLAISRCKIVSNTLTFDFAILSIRLSIDEIL